MPRRNHPTRRKSLKHNSAPSLCSECTVSARRDGSGRNVLHHRPDCSMKARKK